MPLPVVNNLFMVRLVWNYASAPRDAVNDLFFHDDTGGRTGTDLYNSLNTNVVVGLWSQTVSGAHIYKVITTKLDGTAASVDHSTGSVAKWSGGATSTDAILAGAEVVTIRTGFRGRSRRGRIYLPWIAEQSNTNGAFLASDIATQQTAWDTFVAAMKTAAWPLHVCSRLHNDSIEATSTTVRVNVKSQRRRNRR